LVGVGAAGASEEEVVWVKPVANVPASKNVIVTMALICKCTLKLLPAHVVSLAA
jgi:hypothetical protein